MSCQKSRLSFIFIYCVYIIYNIYTIYKYKYYFEVWKGINRTATTATLKRGLALRVTDDSFLRPVGIDEGEKRINILYLYLLYI